VRSHDVCGPSRGVAGVVVANHRGYDTYLPRGRRNEKGDDSRSLVLASDASGGGWRRRQRVSPAVGLATMTSAPGRGNGERISRFGKKRRGDLGSLAAPTAAAFMAMVTDARPRGRRRVVGFEMEKELSWRRAL